jgi:hypothetical protein
MELLQANVNFLSQPVVNGTTGSVVVLTTPDAQRTMLSYQVIILPLFLLHLHSAVTVLRLQDVCGMRVSFRRIRKWRRIEFLLPSIVSEGRLCIFAGNVISGAL